MDLNDLTFRDTYTHTILHPITEDPVLHKDRALKRSRSTAPTARATATRWPKSHVWGSKTQTSV